MSAHIVIAHTDAEQPFHVRVIAENGEPILSSENLADQRDAERVVCVLAEMFGWDEPWVTKSLHDPSQRMVVSETAKMPVDVVHVDERAGSEPTC